MTVTRTHFFIDYTSAIAMGGCCVLVGEKMSYIVEVLIMGLHAKNRQHYFHRPCPVCGWSNWFYANLIDADEKLV